MAVTAWVLVQTEIGHARAVADAIAAADYDRVRVLCADTVTGPHDIIARFEGDDLDAISSAVENVVSNVGGVQNTVTCLSMWVG
ncbi:hypothetical protein AYO38_03730 [bacterium SCGC AG-212-C10]|nr:hypothetical protein AYO38_03730 [bacterium SCGC AG-212-C10]